MLYSLSVPCSTGYSIQSFHERLQSEAFFFFFSLSKLSPIPIIRVEQVIQALSVKMYFPKGCNLHLFSKTAKLMYPQEAA